MNRNIMEALNATPNGGSPQHGFPLSNFVDYHKKGGQFMVVGTRDTVPNGTYRMAVDGFTRTLPCNTANFAHIKENYYFVHVPLSLVSRNAYQLQVDRKQQYSALDFNIQQFPSFDLVAVYRRLLEISQLDVNEQANYKFRDMFGFNIAFGAVKLMDMLGYGYIGDIMDAVSNELISLSLAKEIVGRLFHGKRPTANRLAAYQCIWYHFFRNDIYDNDITARSFNFDDVTVNDGGTPNFDILTTRSLDDFIVECCQLRYVQYKKDIFTGAMPGTQYGPVSSIEIGSIEGLSAQFVGSPTTVTTSFVGETGNGVLYGGTDTDLTSHKLVTQSGSDYDTSGLNSNIAVRGREALSEMDGGFSPEILESVPYNDGQLQSITRPSRLTPRGFDVHDHQVNINGNTGSLEVNGSASSIFTPQGIVSLSGTSGSSLFDVLQLVEAQAVQKWRQKSMLAGNKTAEQFRAHHGVVPRHLIDHLPDFIGSVDNEIHITEITSTADTKSTDTENNLGDIRGRGYGASDSHTFTFHSDDYGILFLLSAIVPENTYDSFGIDYGNTMVSYTDFFQNEFENIGLQAVPKYLVAPSTNDTPVSPDKTGTDTFNPSDGVIGYAPRYFNYKMYPSKVHGLFNGSRLLLDRPGAIDVYGYADMQSFVMPRTDIISMIQVHSSSEFEIFPLTMRLSNLYISPRIFDSLFAVASSNFQDTDQFFSHVRFICEASQPMTVLGLPQF